MRRGMKVARFACSGALIGLAGCFSLARTQPLQQHYVLGAGAFASAGTPPAVLSDLSIGIRRPKLASYLASPFMVVRSGPNQVDFAEFHRWGEPLEAGINRVVAGALVARGIREVDAAPWPARARYDYVIQVDVVRFEGLSSEDSDQDQVEGGVHLLATWEISGPMDGVVIARGTTDFRRRGWRVGDYASLATLLDEGLGVVADDLVVALAGLPPVMDEPHAL